VGKFIANSVLLQQKTKQLLLILEANATQERKKEINK
jgi:hypothetical protein